MVLLISKGGNIHLMEIEAWRTIIRQQSQLHRSSATLLSSHFPCIACNIRFNQSWEHIIYKKMGEFPCYDSGIGIYSSFGYLVCRCKNRSPLAPSLSSLKSLKNLCKILSSFSSVSSPTFSSSALTWWLWIFWNKKMKNWGVIACPFLL